MTLQVRAHGFSGEALNRICVRSYDFGLPYWELWLWKRPLPGPAESADEPMSQRRAERTFKNLKTPHTTALQPALKPALPPVSLFPLQLTLVPVRHP